MSNQNFDYENLNIPKIKKIFSQTSAVKISSLFSKELCKKTYEYITLNEQDIIKKFSNDKRGLVVEEVNKIPLINLTLDDQKFFIKNDGHFSKLANVHILNKINNHLDALNP